MSKEDKYTEKNLIIEYKQYWSQKSVEQIPSSLYPDQYFFNRLKPNFRVLDIGCGIGSLAVQMAKKGCEVIGIDLNNVAIEKARKNAKSAGVQDHCNFSVITDTKILAKAPFQVIVLKAVLTTMADRKDRKKIFQEARRVLDYEGFVYVCDFAQNWQITDYRNRYLKDKKDTGEEGLFKVYKQDGSIDYYAKHFSRKEIVLLVINTKFKIEKFVEKKLKTRSNTWVDGFELYLTI